MRREPRQERSRKRVRKILDATAKLVDREGAAAVTTNAIAKEAGVPIGTLYQFFPNKHDVFQALLERQLGALDAAFEPFVEKARQAQDLDPLVDAAIDTLAEAYLTIPGLAALVQTMRHEPEGGSILSSNNARLGFLISAALSLRIDSARANAIARMLVEAVDGVLQDWLAQDEPDDRTTLEELKEMIRAFLGTLDLRASKT